MSSILTLLVLVVVGGVVVRSVARHTGGDRSPEAETTGFFVFLAMFVALLTFAIGLSGVLSGLIDRPSAGRGVTAGELSSTLIGLPVFIALARTTLLRLRSNPAERGGSGWSAYINAALLTTLVVSLLAAYRLLVGLVDGGRIGTDTGLLIVWLPLWVLHWRVLNEVGDARRPDVYWFLASTGGVIMLTSGGVAIVVVALQRIIDAIAVGTVAARGGNDLESAVILLGLGAITWWWHWLRTGSLRTESTSRLVYLLIVGVFGGLVMMYIGAVGALTQVLVWFFGDPGTTSARRYFDEVVAVAPVALGGAVVWWYHRTVLGPRRDEDRNEVDRFYDYLVAGVAGLVTTGALITLGVTVLTLLTPATAVSSDLESSNIVLAALALLAFGGPTWYLRWRELQQRRDGNEAEARSPVRRFYLLVLLAVAGSVAFGAGIATLSAVLGASTGERSGSLIGNLRIPLASLVGAAALGYYHLRLYLGERNMFTREAVRHITLVVPAGADLSEVEALPGLAISRIDMAANGLDQVDAEAIARAIDAADGDRLLAIVRNGGVETIPLA